MLNKFKSSYPVIPDRYIKMIVSTAIDIIKCRDLNVDTLSILLKNAVSSSRTCGTICFNMGNLQFNVICYSKFKDDKDPGEFDFYFISVFCPVSGVELVYTWNESNSLSIYDDKSVTYEKYHNLK